MTTPKRLTRTYLALTAGLLVLLGMNLLWGSVSLTPQAVLAALLGKGQDALSMGIILQLRLPRAVMVILLGAALSVAGYLLQTFFANPIAGPFVMGISSGAKLAVALKAEKLILLTDVRGVLKDPKDDSTLISQIRLNEVPGLLASGIIGGGMIPKIECCVNALERGVHRTHILDGRIPHSILTEMLSHKGIGTMLWE